MKKYIITTLVASSALLAACTNTSAPTVEPTPIQTPPTESTQAVIPPTGSGQTGSGYEDKEVQDTMNEIDSILSNTSTGKTAQ
jgi:hypothetical protein